MSRFTMPLGGGLALAVATVLLLRPAEVVLDGDTVRVRLGWGFRAAFPAGDVADAARDDRRVLSRGVHGWQGRWLVNTRGRDLVTLRLQPEARARVLGVPVRLRELTVSPADPDGLVTALRSAA